jgi:plastocyanin
MRKLVAALTALVAIGVIGVITAGAGGATKSSDGTQSRGAERAHRVTVPDSDRFIPFALTIRAGDRVRWVNQDTDDHTVVSDDAFDTAGHQGTDQLIGANGGTLALRFNRPGTFVYYCRFHAHLDAFNQPVAPGPDGGIQDKNGNFGTPMSGVITVLPNND